jgi:hypothetical protein
MGAIEAASGIGSKIGIPALLGTAGKQRRHRQDEGKSDD